MEKGKLKKKLALLTSGAVVLSSVSANATTVKLFESTDLGTAGELRSELLSNDVPNGFLNNSEVELKCGEGKCGEGKCGESKKAEDEKPKESKEDSKEESKEVKSETKEDVKEDKSSESKCGEGKCGEGKCGTH